MIKVPFELFEDDGNQEVILPVYLYLCIGQDKCGNCRTTIADIMRNCGRAITTSKSTYDYAESVKDAFEYLQSIEFITAVEKCGISHENQDRDKIKLNDLIKISINKNFPDLDMRCTILYVSDYPKLLQLAYDKNSGIANNSFWRCLVVYFNIIVRIWREFAKRKNAYDNGDSMLEIVQKYPEYYCASISKLNEHINFSEKTTRSIIKQLQDASVIHCVSPRASLGDDMRCIGSVYIRDTEYWKIELEAAKKAAVERYINYVCNKQKGELVN